MSVMIPASPAISQLGSRPNRVVEGDQRIAIRGITWDLYSRLVDAVGEDQQVKLAFDGKDLEIMTTSFLHERFKRLLGRLVEVVTEELEIPCSGGGETTWKRAEIERGLEADQCYYFLAEKLRAVAEASARQSNNLADYPNPDLAIEVDLSPSQVDRQGIYAALAVAEIWRFDGETVIFESLEPDLTYLPVPASRFLPIQPRELSHWIIHEEASDESAWARRLRAWVRAEVSQRMPR